MRAIRPFAGIAACFLLSQCNERITTAEELANLKRETGMSEAEISEAIRVYHAFGEVAKLEGHQAPADPQAVAEMVGEATTMWQDIPQHDYTTAALALTCLRLINNHDTEDAKQLCRTRLADYYNQYNDSKEPSFELVIIGVKEMAQSDEQLAALLNGKTEQP